MALLTPTEAWELMSAPDHHSLIRQTDGAWRNLPTAQCTCTHSYQVHHIRGGGCTVYTCVCEEFYDK